MKFWDQERKVGGGTENMAIECENIGRKGGARTGIGNRM